MQLRSGLAASLLAFCCLVGLPTARADFSYAGGDSLGGSVLLPVGLNLGRADHAGQGTGMVIGGEASIVTFLKGDSGTLSRPWLGLYADGLWDTQTSRWRCSFGPEVGSSIIGVDGGVIMEWSAGRQYVGGTVRGLLTIGFVAVYYRWIMLPDSDAGRATREAGVLLKFPVPLRQ